MSDRGNSSTGYWVRQKLADGSFIYVKCDGKVVTHA
jgi:hypothetical protein